MPVDRPPPTTTQPSEATVNVPPMRFPELRTPRFLLRRIAPADAEAVFLGLSDPKVIQHYGVSYQTPEEARFQMRWFEDLLAQGTGIWWAICEPSSVPPSSLPTSTNHTLSGPPSATRSNGFTIPLVDTTAGSYSRHVGVRHDHNAI